MKANELRIGNYIQWSGNKHKVSKIDIKSSYLGILKKNKELQHIPYKAVSPIKLTEQWLIDFGFMKCKRKNSEIIDWVIFDKEGFDYFVLFHLDFKDGLSCRGVKYRLKHVNQLQNLYFALTNKELTKK